MTERTERHDDGTYTVWHDCNPELPWAEQLREAADWLDLLAATDEALS